MRIARGYYEILRSLAQPVQGKINSPHQQLFLCTLLLFSVGKMAKPQAMQTVGFCFAAFQGAALATRQAS
jgi:hypothetical protein